MADVTKKMLFDKEVQKNRIHLLPIRLFRFSLKKNTYYTVPSILRSILDTGDKESTEEEKSIEYFFYTGNLDLTLKEIEINNHNKKNILLFYISGKYDIEEYVVNIDFEHSSFDLKNTGMNCI